MQTQTLAAVVQITQHSRSGEVREEYYLAAVIQRAARPEGERAEDHLRTGPWSAVTLTRHQGAVAPGAVVIAGIDAEAGERRAEGDLTVLMQVRKYGIERAVGDPDGGTQPLRRTALARDARIRVPQPGFVTGTHPAAGKKRGKRHLSVIVECGNGAELTEVHSGGGARRVRAGQYDDLRIGPCPRPRQHPRAVDGGGVPGARSGPGSGAWHALEVAFVDISLYGDMLAL